MVNIENEGRDESSPYNLEAFYERHGIDFGAGDVFCVGGGDLLAKLKAFLRVLGAFHDEQGHTPFGQIIVVIPPESAAHLQGYQARLNREVDNSSIRSSEAKAKGPWLQIKEAADLRVTSVLSALTGMHDHSAVIVLSAARFRETGSVPEVSQLSLREDVWVPHVHQLCVHLLGLVETTPAYFIVDTGECQPSRDDNRKLLMSLEGLGFAASEAPNNAEAFLAEKLQVWDTHLCSGTLGPVFLDIEALPLKPDEKAFFRIQMLNRAGLHGQALEEIEQFSPDSDLSPIVLCKLARIATDAGASFLAAQFLRPAVAKLSTVEGLALAIDIASEISERDVEERAALHLEKLFPGHPTLLNRQLR